MFQAHDKKQQSASVGSEVDDEEAKSSQDYNLEKMTVPKPTGNKGGDSVDYDDDDDDDEMDDRSV